MLTPEDEPLEQEATEPTTVDDDIEPWFLVESERGNDATDLRRFSTGNDVVPLVDGATYFRRLLDELQATTSGDDIYLLDFRGDFDELLTDDGPSIGSVLSKAAVRGVRVFGLLWRSHPGFLKQSEEQNAEFVREIGEHGGQILLDARTRRAGSHHQKLVVIRRRDQPGRDVAFLGGIDLSHSRRDDAQHLGDPQVMEFPSEYGARPAWHDLQAEVRGPAVHDLEHTFRERWYGSSVLDVPSPLRQLYDRAYHIGSTTSRPLPDPVADDHSANSGTMHVQVLRTYPARLRRYPFAPLGERSIAYAYQKAMRHARRLVYIEDQYLWSRPVADLLVRSLRANPQLHVIVVVPRVPDHDSRATQLPALYARYRTIKTIAHAGGERFRVFDVENHEGTPVYVHAKVVIVDDVWAMVGSDNLNRRSWTHDSELSISVLDHRRDTREPTCPAGSREGARVFARDLRLQLWQEHLDRSEGDVEDLIDPTTAIAAFTDQANALEAWHQSGRVGERPRGRVRPHTPEAVTGVEAIWADLAYRLIYDPDGRALRDRIRRRD